MSAALVHRGPDDAGTWVDSTAGVGLAFRRLSILDLSPLGHQPMRSASGRFTIVFNGEIYNHAELRAQLASNGHVFRGRSDTEVLLAAIDAYGFEDTLLRIRGMFAIAAWDSQERALHLARDRIGEKPLYYGWARRGEVAFFASELTALRAHPAFQPSIDRASLARFARHGAVPAPMSIYEGVWKLPPGAWHTIRRAADVEAAPARYYSVRDVAEQGIAAPLAVTDAEATDLLEAELSRAVGEQMVSDVPVGAFLSGGIDSSTIVALMRGHSTQKVRTFSIGFEDPAFDEAPWARAVATHLGTVHTEHYVDGAEALAVVPELSSVYDEPFADSSQIPTLLVSRLARKHVTVALTGDGGDELFGGYPRYATMRRLAPLFEVPGRRRLAELAHRAVIGLTRDGTAPTLDRRVLDWVRRRTEVARAADLDQFYLLYMSLWYYPQWLVPGSVEPPGVMPLAKDTLSRGNSTERAMLADWLHHLPDDLLVKVDRAAMSVSLETRIPLLDPGVVSLAWRLPYRTKVRGDVGKIVLRNVLRRYLPDHLIDRPKRGFMVPIVAWLRGPLREWAESLLSERRLRDEGYLDAALVRRRWNAFQAGIRDWHGLLWTVLMWQAWLDASTRSTQGHASDRVTG